ncbi:hypothetical protein ACFPTY_19870 [Halomonas beimenensis]|uniref:hypothetical protein n=1 Tax=Halomonas beimenensis TaxID=475662 RepID=UPI00360B5A32
MGTITEIYDYLRLLFARAVSPAARSRPALEAQTVSQMVDQVMPCRGQQTDDPGPGHPDRKGEHLHVIDNMRSQGFIRLRVDGSVYDIDDCPPWTRNANTRLTWWLTAFKVKEGLEQRLAESFETAPGTG